MIRHVVSAVERAFGGAVPVTVITSVDLTDDPLAAYLESERLDVFRGPLDDVFGRFDECRRTRACDWILRLNGDSPLMNCSVLRRVVKEASLAPCDLVTTTFPRTFPTGQNAELIRTGLFDEVVAHELTGHDREHVTQFFYRHPDRFRIRNVTSGDATLAKMSLAVDTLDDLLRLEALSEADVKMFVAG